MRNERGLSKTNNLLFLLKETEQVYQRRVKNDHYVCRLSLLGHERDGFLQKDCSYTLHGQDPLLKCDCAAWIHEWALTPYKLIKLRVMLSKYQNAQVKQYVLLTMQNINKISNKINWTLRFCVTVHCIIIQYCISPVSALCIPLSVRIHIHSETILVVLEYKKCKESELTKGSDIFWPQSLCT